MLHNCQNIKSPLKPITSRHGEENTRLDGWQIETTERKQITLCQRRRQKHPKGRRWSRLTQLSSPPKLSSPPLILLTAVSLSVMSQGNHSLAKTNKHICCRAAALLCSLIFNSSGNLFLWMKYWAVTGAELISVEYNVHHIRGRNLYPL